MFEQRCIALMNSMYNEDTEHAIDLMEDEAHVWGIHSSPLTFAYENFMYDVVAHTCSQKNMNKQWYNGLPPDLKPFLKVIKHAQFKIQHLVTIKHDHPLEIHALKISDFFSTRHTDKYTQNKLI